MPKTISEATPRATSVRLSNEEMEHLETLARFDGVAVAQEIREAVKLLIEARKQDPAFRERVKATLAKGKLLLEQAGASDVAAELDGI